MTLQNLLSLIAAAVGFASAIWFCAGSVSLTASDVIKAADDSWKADPGTAQTLIAQSAEHSAGALLLGVSFLLQVVATQASVAIVPMPHPALSNSLAFAVFVAIATAVLAGVVGIPIYAMRKRSLTRRVRLGE